MKRIAALGLALGMLVLMGCSLDPISNEYITIAKYKGVEVPAVQGLPDITDESVDNNIQVVREGFAEYTEVDRPAGEGDAVVIDYSSASGGEALPSLSAKDYRLTIGANSLFDGFEDNLIGRAPGDSFELTHSFPESYTDATLAGKDVVLKVDVKSVIEKELPDLTDEFVQIISQESETVEEYREEMRRLLEEQKKEYELQELIEVAWAQVQANTELKKFPEDRIAEEKQGFYDHYHAGAEMYGMEFEAFLESMGMTPESFETSVTAVSEANVRDDLIVALIAEKEKIAFTDEEYAAAKEELADTMGYNSVEEMEAEAPEDAIYRYILRDRVKTWVVEHCVQVEAE